MCTRPYNFLHSSSLNRSVPCIARRYSGARDFHELDSSTYTTDRLSVVHRGGRARIMLIDGRGELRGVHVLGSGVGREDVRALLTAHGVLPKGDEL